MRVNTFLPLSIFIIPFFAQAQENSTGRLADSLRSNIMEDLVVTGQYQPQSAKNSLYRVRSISAEQIRLRAATTLEGILNTQLGIRFSNDLTLGESDIQLMGMGGQNVKVLIDGVPILDRGATKQSLSQIDVNNIKSIEIVEGPMSVIYGTDALAGVINIITKKGLRSDQLQISARILEETVGSEYKPFTKEGTHNSNLGINWQNKGWLAKASASRNNFGGWQGSKSGRELEWAPKDQWLASGTIGYNHANFNSWYRLDYMNEDIYTPGALNENIARAIDKNYLTDRYTHTLQANGKINDRLRYDAVGSIQNYKRRTETISKDFRTGENTLTTGAGEQDVVRFNSYMLRGSMIYQLSDSLSVQAGLDINSNAGSGARIEGSPRINDYALFLSSEWKINEWAHVRPGLRVLKNSDYDAPPVIPSLNTKFKLSDNWDIRAAYARGFRSPALRELYFTFFDSNHAIAGNTNLKAEYSNSFNTYITWYSRQMESLRIISVLGGFYNTFDNQITLGTDPNNGSVSTYINIDKYKTAGGTFENTFYIKNLQANIGFSYIGRYNRLSEAEINIPSMVWYPEVNSTLMYSIPKWGMELSFFYKFYGERPGYCATAQSDGGIATQRTSVAAYHMADFSLNKNINRYLTIVGGVRNVFDITRIDASTLSGDGGAHSSSVSNLPISYGRSFFVG